ncbi:hypothetical protein CEQ07_07165 [Oligella urethralis]|nr:hypothetical protein CEQ07_07165 [Oligella urethralis]
MRIIQTKYFIDFTPEIYLSSIVIGISKKLKYIAIILAEIKKPEIGMVPDFGFSEKIAVQQTIN